MSARTPSSRGSRAIRAIRARDTFRARATCTCRSSSRGRVNPCPPTTSARGSVTPRRSWPTATRARAPRWRRSRSARRATTRATTPAHGTSGRATPSCRRNGARRVKDRASNTVLLARSSRRRDPLGDVDEGVAERAAQLVPAFDPVPGLSTQSRTVELERLVLAQPALDLGQRHLRVKLHAPGAVAEAERLRAHVVARQLDGSRGQAVRVVMPLEGVKPLRQPSE